jgi:hypothetical protein
MAASSSRPPRCISVAPGWQCFFSHKRNRKWYWNVVLKTSQWMCPPNVYFVALNKENSYLGLIDETHIPIEPSEFDSKMIKNYEWNEHLGTEASPASPENSHMDDHPHYSTISSNASSLNEVVEYDPKKSNFNQRPLLSLNRKPVDEPLMSGDEWTESILTNSTSKLPELMKETDERVSNIQSMLAHAHSYLDKVSASALEKSASVSSANIERTIEKASASVSHSDIPSIDGVNRAHLVDIRAFTPHNELVSYLNMLRGAEERDEEMKKKQKQVQISLPRDMTVQEIADAMLGTIRSETDRNQKVYDDAYTEVVVNSTQSLSKSIGKSGVRNVRREEVDKSPSAVTKARSVAVYGEALHEDKASGPSYRSSPSQKDRYLGGDYPVDIDDEAVLRTNMPVSPKPKQLVDSDKIPSPGRSVTSLLLQATKALVSLDEEFPSTLSDPKIARETTDPSLQPSTSASATSVTASLHQPLTFNGKLLSEVLYHQAYKAGKTKANVHFPSQVKSYLDSAARKFTVHHVDDIEEEILVHSKAVELSKDKQAFASRFPLLARASEGGSGYWSGGREKRADAIELLPLYLERERSPNKPRSASVYSEPPVVTSTFTSTKLPKNESVQPLKRSSIQSERVEPSHIDPSSASTSRTISPVAPAPPDPTPRNHHTSTNSTLSKEALKAQIEREMFQSLGKQAKKQITYASSSRGVYEKVPGVEISVQTEIEDSSFIGPHQPGRSSSPVSSARIVSLMEASQPSFRHLQTSSFSHTHHHTPSFSSSVSNLAVEEADITVTFQPERNHRLLSREPSFRFFQSSSSSHPHSHHSTFHEPETLNDVFVTMPEYSQEVFDETDEEGEGMFSQLYNKQHPSLSIQANTSLKEIKEDRPRTPTKPMSLSSSSTSAGILTAAASIGRPKTHTASAASLANAILMKRNTMQSRPSDSSSVSSVSASPSVDLTEEAKKQAPRDAVKSLRRVTSIDINSSPTPFSNSSDDGFSSRLLRLSSNANIFGNSNKVFHEPILSRSESTRRIEEKVEEELEEEEGEEVQVDEMVENSIAPVVPPIKHLGFEAFTVLPSKETSHSRPLSSAYKARPLSKPARVDNVEPKIEEKGKIVEEEDDAKIELGLASRLAAISEKFSMRNLSSEVVTT